MAGSLPGPYSPPTKHKTATVNVVDVTPKTLKLHPWANNAYAPMAEKPSETKPSMTAITRTIGWTILERAFIDGLTLELSGRCRNE